MRLVIDAGHGGKDSGATGNGLLEKNINLSCSKMLTRKLQRYNVDIINTRTSDVDFDLNERSKYIKSKNPDLVISLHVNAGGGTGAEIIKSKFASKHISILADLLGQSIVNALDTNLRSVYTRDNKNSRDYYALHRLGSLNTLILEPLFIDCDDDAKILKLDNFADMYTDAIIEPIIKMYDLRKVGATMKWEEIIEKYASNPADWKKAINAIVAMSNATSDIGDLETLKFLPKLLEKINNNSIQ